MYDTAIIGAGSAGVTAAIYAARAGLSAVIIEKAYTGGQLANITEIENYPGAGRIAGYELAAQFKNHLAMFDVPIITSEVKKIVIAADSAFVLRLDAAEELAKAVIITTGASPKRLCIEDENLAGVSYCAACDGNFYRKKTVCVIGGGNTAVHDAIFLSQICEKVYIIHRRDVFRADKQAVDKLKMRDNIEAVMEAQPVRFAADEAGKCVCAVELNVRGEARRLDVSGVFVAIGTHPQTDFLDESINVLKDENGAIITDDRMRTNIPGIFAAGDARKTVLKQIITAAADGAVAAMSAAEYIVG